MRTSTKVTILAFVFTLTSCGPTTEEIARNVVSATAESGTAVVVGEQHTPLCSRDSSHIHCVSQIRPRLDSGLAPDLWGRETEYSADVYCALDLTITECERYSKALLAAADHWGNYSPVSLYAVGTDQDAALQLVDILCNQPERRKNQSYKFCKELHSDAGDPEAIEFLRSLGLRAIESGDAEWEGYCNCNRGWSTFEIFMSVNWGYLDEPMFGESLADAHEHIFHEYFHVVQNSHLSSPEKWGLRKAALGPRWFHEGGATYMSLLIPRELMNSHKLDSSALQPDAQSPFSAAMSNRLKSTRRIFRACEGGLLDTGNNKKCGSGDLNAAYSGGAWAHAYLAYKHGADRLLEVLYPNLEEMGFEDAFIYTYGQSLIDFYTEFDEFLKLPLDEQLAILPKQEDTARTLEPETQDKIAALHNWEFSYYFSPNSIELSSQYAPETKNIQSLSVKFTPAIKDIPASVVKHEGYYDGVFKQTIGFNMHEYSISYLDVSLTDHVIEIPRGKTGFKMDMNITIAAELTSGETDTVELADSFTRPDDYYPTTILSIPENLNVNLSLYDHYEIPDPNAHAVMLATIGGTWDNVWHEQVVRKPTIPLRIGLFGKVYEEDYETIRDLLEVLAVVAPSLDIGFATDLNQITFPIHFVDCTEQLQQAWSNCRVDGPRGEYVSVEHYDQDQAKYDMFDDAWGYLYISRQGVNRHTLTHEMAHAFGLNHWNIENCSMGPGYAQSSNWTAFELMTLATIYDSPAVTNGQTREDMRTALSIPIDTTWNDYVNNPDSLSTTPGDIWVQFGRELAIQTDEAIKSSTQLMESE